MNVEQAIRIIDEHFVWLAGRKMISNVMLQRLSGALKCIVDHTEALETEIYAGNNSFVQQTEKMKVALIACGFTEKGVAETMQIDSSILQKWADQSKKAGITLNSEMWLEHLKQSARINDTLSEADVFTVKQYVFLVAFETKNEKANQKNEEIKQMLREQNRHLAEWFKKADAGKTVSEKAIYEEAYQYHLNQWS